MSQPGVPGPPGGMPPYGALPYPMHPQYAPQPPPQQYRPRPSQETRRDVEAAWKARLELGLDFEDHIAAGLADRVEQLAQQRLMEMRAQSEAQQRADKRDDSGGGRQLALGIVSVVMGVPITAIAGPGMEGGVAPMVVTWVGIVGVNLAHAIGLRRSRRRRS